MKQEKLEVVIDIDDDENTAEKIAVDQMPEVQLLLKRGKAKGSLNNHDFEEILEKIELDPEEIDSIYLFLQKEG